MREERTMLSGRGNIPFGRTWAMVALFACAFIPYERITQAQDLETTMSWSLTTAGDWALGAVSVKPASGSTISDASVSSAHKTGTLSLSWYHEVYPGENRLLIVGVSVGSNTDVSSVTYGGTPLIELGFKAYGGVRMEIWRLENPAADWLKVVVTIGSSADITAGAVSFTGVDQDDPLPNSVWRGSSSTSPSVVVVHGSNELVLDTVSVAAGTGTLSCLNDEELWNLGATARGGGSTGAESTAIRVASLTATGSEDRVVLAWKTEAEINTAGFNVLRAEAIGGPWVKLSQDLIPSRGSSWQGASYEFSDETREAGTVYWYCVEEVSTGGGTTRYPPQMVWDEGLTDADGDGMPDLWETPLGIDSGKADDADADDDGDGSPNLEEYLAGTSPVDAEDCPRLCIERGAEGNLVVLIWPGRPGRTYRLEAADSMAALLGHSPSALWVMESGSNGPMRSEDALAAEGRMKFYRLIISPPE